LSGANRVPMGKRKLHSQRVHLMHRSVFDCIEGLSQNHQKDYHKQVKASVFDRLKWLAAHSLDHQIIYSTDLRAMSKL
jgi:hypothetical protein